MSSLNDLSTELLQEITSHLQTHTLAPLRLVSRGLELVVNQRFFKRLTLPSNRLNGAAAMLEAIVSSDERQGTVYAEHGDWQKAEPELEILVALALASLRNVSAVRLKCTTDDPMAQLASADDIHRPRALPPPRDLRAHHRHPLAPARPPPFSSTSLETLSITAPRWYKPIPRLYGVPPPPTYEGPEPPPLSSQIASIVAQNPNLRALYIADGKNWDDVWDVLLKKRIRLRGLRLQMGEVSTKLLSYLGSYTGLERLALLGNDARGLAANDTHAELFYTEILPRHSSTLRELRCLPAFESRWCFGAYNVANIMALKELRVLEVSLAGPEQVPLLFETVISLPHLTHFAILASLLESERNARCGNPEGRKMALLAVEAAVASLRAELLPEFAQSVVEDEDGYEEEKRWDREVLDGPLADSHTAPNLDHGKRWRGSLFRAFRRALWAGKVVRIRELDLRKTMVT
uniref:F-box domain-containing protein n=1 Tax=Mycena chlorophos TaxID=658473 RepID=A0ABQ0LV26_MYCCL|nr:predicted protein [Mycena chlorophos]